MNAAPEIDVTRDHWTNRRGDYWRADRKTLTVEFWNSPVRGWQASKVPIDAISWMMEMGYLEEVALPADKPEPRKAREWDVHLRTDGEVYDCCEPNGEILAMMTKVRVRETLPNEPTMEEIRALVVAAKNACQGMTRNQSLDLLQALTPFQS
jgi:hypothetical protein